MPVKGRHFSPLLMGVLSLAPAALAQKPVPAPVFPVNLEVVKLTATVRDEKGRAIADLAAEDFTVFEDGRPQKLVVFARSVEPGQEDKLALDLGLLMDTSESMLQVLRLSQESAARFLEAIPRARELFTIFFDSDIRISRYDSENQQGLIDRIFEAKGRGNTALYDAIAVYLSRVQEGQGRKVLVVFTDGEDFGSALSLSELNGLVRSSTATIYPIAFFEGMGVGSSRATASKAVLMSLADMTGGLLFMPHSSKDMPGIYQKILDELSSQYVLGFVSDNTKPDGKYRRLKVEARRKGLRVRHREGYMAPEPPEKR